MPTGHGTYRKLSTPSPWSVRNKEVKFVRKKALLCSQRPRFCVRCAKKSSALLPKAGILCPLSVLERVRIIEGFLKEMYENFVGT